MQIIITGCRGSGKTTIAALIAKTLEINGQNVILKSNSKEDERLIKRMCKEDLDENVIFQRSTITIIDIDDREDEASLKSRKLTKKAIPKNETLHESQDTTVDREASTDADS